MIFKCHTQFSNFSRFIKKYIKIIMTYRLTQHWLFQFLYWTMLFLIFNYFIISVLTLFRMVFFRVLTDGGERQKDFPLQNITHIHLNDETWHSYALPKEYTKNILITSNSPWVLSAFFHWILENFAISKNTDIGSISIHNF